MSMQSPYRQQQGSPPLAVSGTLGSGLWLDAAPAPANRCEPIELPVGAEASRRPLGFSTPDIVRAELNASAARLAPRKSAAQAPPA